MEQISFKTYHAAIYLRLSKEDSNDNLTDKTESNSILNQKAYILDYLKSRPEIEVCEIYADDGYSGVNFNRPQFQKMFEAIKRRKINCIIVKDLSRFGRNYIEVGGYIEKLFPLLGVRFIAINDNYDSQDNLSHSNDLVVSFKNLINDAYSHDISVKIRSHLEIKRKNGEFIGAFAVYGYKKSPENKNQLIIDKYAAQIVKDIYQMRIMGMSNRAIADKLNDLGILSPYDYKRKKGINYTTIFQIYEKTKWTATAISRILKNEIYTGVLIQGKESTPNYKVKKRMKKEKTEWIRVEDAHEAIISKADFLVVQQLLMIDTRTSPDKKIVGLYAGYIKCGDCGSNMIKKTIPVGEKTLNGIQKKYVYYICAGNKKNKSNCSAHRIREDILNEAIFLTIKQHISYLLYLKKALEFLKDMPRIQRDTDNLNIRIIELIEEIKKYNQLKISIDEDMQEGILTKEEFIQFKKIFEQRIEEETNSILNLKKEIDLILNQDKEKQLWMEEFLIHKNIKEMTRNIVVHLISAIYIYEDNRIEIEFRYEEQFYMAMCLIKQQDKYIKNIIDKGGQ